MLPTASLSRKTTLLLTASLLVFSLVACGSSTPMAPASSAPSARESAATDSLLRQVKTQIREATDKGSLDSWKPAPALAKQAPGRHRPAPGHY